MVHLVAGYVTCIQSPKGVQDLGRVGVGLVMYHTSFLYLAVQRHYGDSITMDIVIWVFWVFKSSDQLVYRY